MADLLSCPFCGGEAKYRADHTTERVDTVSCFRCDFHISDDGDVGSCVAAWNRRASPAPVALPAGVRELQRYEPINGELVESAQGAYVKFYGVVAMLAASPVPSTATQAGAVETPIDPYFCVHKFAINPRRCVKCGWDFQNGEPPPPETARDRAERRVSEQPEILTDLISLSFDDEDGWAYAIRAPGQNFVPGSHNMNADPHAAIAEMAAALKLGDIERAQSSGERPTGHVSIAHDGFSGDIIGHYETREGKRGVVVQQDGTRVVHVYGEKGLFASAPATGGGE